MLEELTKRKPGDFLAKTEEKEKIRKKSRRD